MNDEPTVTCPHYRVFKGVEFRCGEKFGHWGECMATGKDWCFLWYPTQEEKTAVLQDILREAKESKKP